jgi:hypothetical protein
MTNNKNKTWLCDNCLSYNIEILNDKNCEMDVYCFDCKEHNYKVSEWFINRNKKTVMEVA